MSIIDGVKPSGEHGSVLDLLLSMREFLGILVFEYVFSFDVQQLKWEDNLKIVPNLSYSNNLVKLRVVLGFLGMLSPNLFCAISVPY